MNNLLFLYKYGAGNMVVSRTGDNTRRGRSLIKEYDIDVNLPADKDEAASKYTDEIYMNEE